MLDYHRYCDELAVELNKLTGECRIGVHQLPNHTGSILVARVFSYVRETKLAGWYHV